MSRIEYSILELGHDLGDEYRFKMPSELTLLGVNPIQSATAMVFIEGFNFGTLQPLNSFAATGYEAVPARLVYGFTLDGIRYYSYSTQHLGGDAGGKYPFERIFKDMESAAAAGYAPQLDLLSRPW